MDISRIDIPELADLLEDRKNDNQNIALILGSRTGALFRNQTFIEEMAHHSTSTYSFVHMNSRERFSKCYTLLPTVKQRIERKEIEILIRNIDVSTADYYLAELVKQNIFKLIISTTADDLLYDAFTTLGLKEKHDFVDFDLGRISLTNNIDEIRLHEKISACKVIKFYNDLDTFMHILDEPQEQKKICQCLKNLLGRMKIKEVLVVGIDPTWDKIILSALPSKMMTVWFINEDEKVKETFQSAYKQIEQFKFIIGGKGGYEKFLQGLYTQINPGIPPHLYELIGQLQRQLNMMQRDLTNIKNGLKNHLEYPSEQVQQDTSKDTAKPSHKNKEISADVLLITATDIETQAIFDLFPDRSKKVIDGRIYYNLGSVGIAKTFMAQSTGPGPTRAYSCIQAAIEALSPQVVIMVGVAFGLYPEKQKIGDILVSSQIEDYDPQKIGTGPDEQPKIYARGNRVAASDRLLNRFIAGRHEWLAPPDVHFGLILSGSKLISHKGFRDELLRIAPEAIGGEMEGSSLYEAANSKHVEWVLIKAICDWADANKNDNYQKQAAKNAARFVIEVVSQDQFVNQR